MVMAALDIALLLMVGTMSVTGFMRGFVQESLSLLAWVVAVIAVRLFLAPITDLVSVWLGPGTTASIVSFAGLFVITFYCGKLIARWMGERTRTSLLGPIDRVLGLGFGAVKALVVATLAFLAFNLAYNSLFGITAKRPEWMTQSRSYPLLKASGDAMSQFVADRRRTSEDADNAFDAIDE